MFNVSAISAKFKIAAIRNRKLPDLWNLCSDLDDLSIASRVLQTVEPIGELFDSIQGQITWVNVKINYQPNHYLYYSLIFKFGISNNKVNHFKTHFQLSEEASIT